MFSKFHIMPLNVPDKIPAIQQLEKENIFVMNQSEATRQDIRPLRIIILNLMPLKVTTETDLIRLLSNTPLQVELELMQIKGHTPKNTSIEHMKAFYKSFDSIKSRKFDGLIVTGAPVELLPFEEVTYWEEMKAIMDWAQTNVTSSMFICWGAQAGLFHYYGIPKHALKEKMFGVFKHHYSDSKIPIFRGFDDEFYVPHSRHTEVREEDISKVGELSIIGSSEEAGVNMVMAKNGRQLFITGHFEYSQYTLDNEYKRDLAKGFNLQMPLHYYRDDDPKNKPFVRWKSHANLIFSNWLNYYVYQETPYDLDEIG